MKNCKTCNKEFIFIKRKTTFCSHQCQARWASTLSHGKPKPSSKKGQNVSCITCNKSFYVAKKRFEKGNVKYCSRSCLAKVHLAKFIPEYGFKPTGKPKHTYKYVVRDGRRIRLHRYIMEQYLGRKLERWEHVHHINDDSSDNRIENLIVLSNSEHQKEEYKHRKKLISSSSSLTSS